MLAMQQAPLAALAWLGASGEMPALPVLFATPVHLEAGMQDLVLFAGTGFDATDAERERLAGDIAAFFGDDPRVDFRGGEMFLHLPPEMEIETVPLHEAQGEAVRDKLPRGENARRVHTWMNELQMFLHDHALNRERAARGLPSLNGIWAWGEGLLPPVERRGVTVFAATLPLRGMGLLLGEAREKAGLAAMLPSSSGHHVIEVVDCIDALDADDPSVWRSAVERVSQEVLLPVLEWLAENRDVEAVLHAGDGRARELRGGKENWLWRVLRRKVSLDVVEE